METIGFDSAIEMFRKTHVGRKRCMIVDIDLG